MEEGRNSNKEGWIRLIESQKTIADRYSDIKRISTNAGDGNFSLVFTANDKYLKKKRKVALKFLDPLADQYRQNCFHREADILKDLRRQRNILPILQEKSIFEQRINEVTFRLYYYSSYLARFNVKHFIYNEENNLLMNILFFREMCKAVQRIHSNKIYHRDLTPGNFLVFGKRYVCLSDFGTARYFGKKEIPLLNNYSAPVGDTRYTAPELLCGLNFSDYHNYCADLYSLGAILFELFTKTVLGSVIYSDNEIDDLISYFGLVPERNRIKVFDGFIDSVRERRDLFSIRIYNDSIPKEIAHEVDKLYKSMACLNYKEREKNFQRIFLRINVCERIIRSIKKYEKWMGIKKEIKKERLKFERMYYVKSQYR